jgi:hypothetical protein
MIPSLAHLKIAEERVQNEVEDDERREDGVDNADEDETAL